MTLDSFRNVCDIFGSYSEHYEVLDRSSQLVCGELTITIHLFHPRLSPHRTASSCSQLGSCQEGVREGRLEES